uniref:Uncharacterized protein n=1 Tax=Sipha flava TaxID=143950 RepID=A0A2S2RA82_9HEMI
MARRVTVQRVLAVLVLTASVVLAAQVNPSSFNLTAAKAPETTTTATTAISVTDYPKTWVANLFYETLVNFTVSEDVGNSACRQQTQMYIKHLRNDSFWALQT